MDDRAKHGAAARAEAPQSAQSDAEVLARLDEVWRQHAGRILERCVEWSGGRPEDGREAFSRAWSRAAASMIANKPRLEDPLGWLLTIAYRTCMDLHRERSRRGEEELDVARLTSGSASPHLLGPNDPERLALDKELRCIILGAVDQLPPRLRDPFRAYMRSGDYRAVMQRFDITYDNARKRIEQARAIVRKQLGEYRRGGGSRRRR